MKKKDLKNAQLIDLPMNSNQRKTLSRYIGTKDNRKVYLFNKDEKGMFSHELLAWSSQRMSEAALDMKPFGGIPMVVLDGNHGQLGPVGATDLHCPPKPSCVTSRKSQLCIVSPIFKCDLFG